MKIKQYFTQSVSEARLASYQTPKMDFLALKAEFIISSTFFSQKNFIKDTWEGSQYAAGYDDEEGLPERQSRLCYQVMY